MKKKLVFTIDTPILESYKEYYVLDSFNDNYDIVMIDISPIINRSAFERVKDGLMKYDNKHVMRFFTWQSLYSALDSFSEDTVIIDSGCNNLKHHKLYSYIGKRGFKYGYMVLNCLYESATISNNVKRIKQYFRGLQWYKILNSIYIRLPMKWFKIRPASFVIINSDDEINNCKKKYYCDEETKFLIVHSNTYEDAVSHIEDKRLIPEKYCVWMDSYIPYHPDLSQLNTSVDSDSYYKSLRNFFNWIQNSYNIKVVISAHPRSNYDLHSDAYRGFEVIKFQSCLLVRDAEFVLTAASTSFLYAITFCKPILFIYQNALSESLPSHIQFITQLANELHTKPINIDVKEYSKDLIDGLLTIDKQLYLQIGDKYIEKGFDGSIKKESYKHTIKAFMNSI